MLYTIKRRKGKLSSKRIKFLEEIGFSWNTYKDKWSEMFEELKQYEDKHKHCNVSSKDKNNPQLAKWVDRTAPNIQEE